MECSPVNACTLSKRYIHKVLSVWATHSILQAHRQGRVDAFIQSTDKNFLVPVGGSVVASCSEAFVKEVAQTYPG